LPKPQIWVLRDSKFCWHKVVSTEKPKGQYDTCVIGPIDTELNAEELADRMTQSWLNGNKLMTYAEYRKNRPPPSAEVKNPEPKPKPKMRTVDDDWQ